MRNIPYGKQDIDESDIAAVVSALKSEFLTQGPLIQKFETDLARYVHAPFACAVANGTAALHLAAMGFRVKPGQKVITSPITFSASANCVGYCGGDVDFADIHPETFLLDAHSVRRKLEAAPKGAYAGIIPIDFAGLPVNMETFRELADEFGLWILEDACHALGGSFLDSAGKRHHCGDASLAEAAVFSFHPVKHVACGEGGAITVRDKTLFDRLLSLRTHGMVRDPAKLRENHGPWYHELQELGFNYRLPDILAALGSSQLARAEAGLARRKEIARAYQKAFQGTSVRTQFVPEGYDHAWHLFVIRVRNRKELYLKLREEGIHAQVHYIPVHLMPYYRDKGFRKGMFPLAEAYYEECLSLPMFPTLTQEEQSFIVEKVLELSA